MNKPRSIQDVLYFIMKITLTQFLLMVILTSLVSAASLKGQGILDRKVSIDAENTEIKSILSEIEKQTSVVFTYRPRLIKASKKISFKATDARLADVLVQLFSPEISFLAVDEEEEIVLQPSKDLNAGERVQTATEILAITVSGKVTDETGQALPGVNVVEKGTTNGTTTDADGEFSLSVQDKNSVLVFSFIGYATQEILIGNRTEFSINLKPDIKALDEVVIVGYGVQKKINLTGSVTSLSPEELVTSSVLRVDQMLQGRVSGVLVTSSSGAPGASTTIRIRGNNSITAGSEPLYVIDGIIGGGDLNTLNPNDIASIDVLKDVSSTAIYGSRGSNGVILITTKRGAEGKDKINININQGWQTLPRQIAMLNGTEYAELLNEVETSLGRPAIFSDPASFGEGTNWQEEITRTAPLTNMNLSMSGGKNLKYYLSGNYFNQEGIILNSGIKRYQFRLNLDNNLSEKVLIGSSINIGHTKTNNNTVALTGFAGSALSTPPVIPVYNENGEFAYRNPHPAAVADFNNPVASATLPTSLSTSNNLLGNIFAEYKPKAGLILKSTFGIDAFFKKNSSYIPGSLPAQKWTKKGGEASLSQSQGFTWQNENTVNFSKKLNDHNEFDVLGGITYQQGVSEEISASAIKFATDVNMYNNLSTGDPATRKIGSGYSSWNMISFLGRANYILKNRYLFTVVGRYDGSSRLGNNNKYAFFPSGAFAWIVSEEAFMKNLNLFSSLKLRTSFGKSGNQAVGIYQTLSTYRTISNFVSGNVQTVALVPSRLENPDLRWETLTQFDLGLEASFFNNKLRIEADYYKSRTRDLLLEVEIPTQTGFRTMLQNIGEVSNEGIELAITSVNIENKDFSWETSFTISSNRNEVISLGNNTEIITHIYNYGYQPAGILRVGQPIGSFFGAVTEGLWRSQEEITNVGTMLSAWPGMRRYKDLSGNGIFEDGIDYKILGNGNPKFFGGVGNTIRFKNIELNFFFQGTYGNKIFNGWVSWNGSSNPQTNQFKEAVNRWSVNNPDSDIPRAGGNNQENERTPSDKWIFDGSHLRLKTLNFLYTIPMKTGKDSFVKMITINLTGNNLWLLSRYDKGYDPEVNTYGTSSVLRGYDYAAYPNYRSFAAGVNFGF